MTPRPASDLGRALGVIRMLRLKGPHDGPDAFTVPRDPEARRDLADLIYDLEDEHAARAILDLPPKAYRVEMEPNPARSPRPDGPGRGQTH